MALPNGGFMICESRGGRFVEVNEQLDRVWTYVNPVTSAGAQNQNYTFSNFENESFRAEKYPPNYAGFSGRIFDAPQVLEDANNLSDACITTASLAESTVNSRAINPVEDGYLELLHMGANVRCQLLDTNGKVHDTWTGNIRELEVASGVYLLQWQEGYTGGNIRIVVL